jgi:Uncharacterized ABC-type transport system, permease component
MDWGNFFSLTIALFCPLTIVAFGGMFSERSGIINLALEGIMVVGAMFGCLTLTLFNTNVNGTDVCTVPGMEQLLVLLAIVVAVITGVLYAWLLAFAAIKLEANQVITGTALNMIAPAFGVVLVWGIQGQGSTTIRVPTWVKIGSQLADTNAFNHFMFTNLFLTTIICIILFVVLTVFFYKTRLGLRIRACGENPQAADSVGINVHKMRYIGTMIGGALAAIGGMGYVMATSTGFSPASGVMGYGFLALAVMIFGNWKPVGVLLAGLFFTFCRVLANYISIPGLDSVSEISQLYRAIPYLITIIVLVLASKKSKAPKAEGIPYDKGQRA